MGKNKKPKKLFGKLAVQTLKSHLNVKNTIGNASYATPSTSKTILPNFNPTKNGSTTNGESTNEKVNTDFHIDMDSIDHSITREPINLGVKNVRQIMNCVKEGTIEVKDLILNECNIIYECKICVNLFRSLANFIAHKRIYCKNHFCEKMMLFDSTVLQFNDEDEEVCEENDNEIEEEDPPEEHSETIKLTDIVSPVSSLTTNSSSENINPEEDKNVRTHKRKFIDNCIKKVENENEKQQNSKSLDLKLCTIKSNPNAVFQKLQTNEQNNENVDKEKVKKEIISELFKDAKKDANYSIDLTEIQALKRQRLEEIFSISDDKQVDDNENQMNETVNCDICSSTFTSSKTYKVHLRTIHSTNRLVYPCPLCSLTFKQLSNATRHIIQIHKRTKTQSNTLREVMKSRAYSTNSSENSSEIEDMSDGEDKEVDEQKCCQNKDEGNKVGSEETNNSLEIIAQPTDIRVSKTSGRRVKESARINAVCVYNCGNVFDWAPAKRSHEKSCRKRFEITKEDMGSQLIINGSSHTSIVSSTQSSKSFKINSMPNCEVEADSGVQIQTISSNQELSIIPNHTSNLLTNITLPNSVEEKIKEFADFKSLRCKLCPSQDFMNSNQLLQHSLAHLGYNIYRCHGCSYHSIYDEDMKYHLMNNHNIEEEMICKHYQTLPTFTQPRLMIVPLKAKKSVNGSDQPSDQQTKGLQNKDKNSKLKIHLRTMGNTSKKCYEIVDK